jgi:hypothetical protein
MGHIDNFKKWGNKAAKAVTEQDGAQDIMSVPEKFKAESDNIAQKRNAIVQMETNLANEKVQLNKLVTDLQAKISAENAAVANAAKARQASVEAPAPVPPTV